MEEMKSWMPLFCAIMGGVAWREKRKLDFMLASMRWSYSSTDGVDEVFVVACAGVVDEDVEAAEGGEGELHGVLRGLLFGGVSGVEHGSSAERSYLGAEGVEPFCAAGCDDEVGALMGEGEGCGAADAGAGSGDDGSFAGERGGRRVQWSCLLILGLNAAILRVP